MQNINEITFDQALKHLGDSVSALIVADENADTYHALVRRGVFTDVVTENGSYTDLVHTLWFHHYDDGRKITDTYNVFVPNMGKFAGKYSKRIKLLVNTIPHLVQMSVIPMKDNGQYLFVLDELDESMKENEEETEDKVNSIQNSMQNKMYVYTMAFDLVSDTTSSIALTEISNEPLNYQMKYSQWRDDISKMIPEGENQRDLFLKQSDPAYLRANYKPGDVQSFDVQMVNLDGIHAWVKLIFSRMKTNSKNDYRFVYMVQNIAEEKKALLERINQYEIEVSTDSLTKVFNHGRIETELRNAIEKFDKDGSPVGLMILDIDHFKSVNDRFGHAVGDTTLSHLAEITRSALADKNAVVGRWGGEEFAVVVYGEEGETLNETAEMIRSTVESAEFDVVKSITCSIGVTEVRTGDDHTSWFNRADHALYAAKTAGRNRVICE